ncbi:MAG: hypothetical protein F6K19_17560 [Cyanothece sp. SIO1E1]|nr:hypothetical protein [Cyanothece sp. SIO1E1]
MTPKDRKLNKAVTFTAELSDQTLLKAVAAELDKGHYSSFSELCKHALRQLLLTREPTQSLMLFMELERQVMELKVKLSHLERAAAWGQSAQVDHINGQMLELTRRLEYLENQAASGSQAAPEAALPVVETPSHPVDPLLNRLGPLLEDF